MGKVGLQHHLRVENLAAGCDRDAIRIRVRLGKHDIPTGDEQAVKLVQHLGLDLDQALCVNSSKGVGEDSEVELPKAYRVKRLDPRLMVDQIGGVTSSLPLGFQHPVGFNHLLNTDDLARLGEMDKGETTRTATNLNNPLAIKGDNVQ